MKIVSSTNENLLQKKKLEKKYTLKIMRPEKLPFVNND